MAFELFIPPKTLRKLKRNVDKQYGQEFYDTITWLRKDKTRDGDKKS